MRVIVTSKPVGIVADFDKGGKFYDPKLQLATESDAEMIKEHFGNRSAVRGFGGFLVKIEDGEYAEVYGFHGSIAYVGKTVYKVTMTYSDGPSGKRRESGRACSNRPATVRGVR